MQPMQPLQIFRSGSFTAMGGEEFSFSDADLRATAAAYRPELHEAPLVVGHPKDDAQAFGWVRGLTVRDGNLEADPDQVDEKFAELVRAGRFKKISASFYRPESKQNPVPGVWYLRHVGFLGAQPPAVKGLRPPAFAGSEEDCLVIEGAVAVPAFAESTHHEEGYMDPKELAAREAALKEQEANFAESSEGLRRRAAEIDAREKELKAREDKIRREGIASFVEDQVKAGRVLAVDKEKLVSFMTALGAEIVVEFAEAGQSAKVPGLDFLKDFLGRMPKQVEFGEVAGGAMSGGSDSSFAGPQGTTVDPARLEIHNKAVAFQEKNGCDYMTAVRAVGGK